MRYLLILSILVASVRSLASNYQCRDSLYSMTSSLDDANRALIDWINLDIKGRDFIRPKVKADHPLMSVMLAYGKNAQNPTLTPDQISSIIKNLFNILSFKNSFNETIREKLKLNTESGAIEGITSGWFADNGVWLTTIAQIFENKNMSEDNFISTLKERYKLEAAILHGNVFEGNALDILAQTFVDSYFRFENIFHNKPSDLDKYLFPLLGVFERANAIDKADLRKILNSRIDYWLANKEKKSETLFSGLLFFGKAGIARYFDNESISKLELIAEANSDNPNLCQNIYATIYETFLILNKSQ